MCFMMGLHTGRANLLFMGKKSSICLVIDVFGGGGGGGGKRKKGEYNKPAPRGIVNNLTT